MLLKSGGDYGWPECYYDGMQKKLVLAPEYGGDGGKAVGVCATKMAPVAAFPAHWAPNGMVRYDKKQFPTAATVTASSSPFTVHGIGRRTRKAAIT
jgi:glucose/arabinose dehydrogenase